MNRAFRDEVERVAKLLQVANERDKRRLYGIPESPWQSDYDCIKDAYRAMARAVIRDRKKAKRRAAK